MDVLKLLRRLFPKLAMREQLPLRILAVCSGNTCRSPMAEVLIPEFFNAHVDSAGYNVGFGGDKAALNAMRVVRLYGADLEGHVSRPIPEVLNSYDLVLVMTASLAQSVAENYIFDAWLTEPFSPFQKFEGDGNPVIAGLHVRDPFGSDLQAYHKAALDILSQVYPLLVDYVRPEKAAALRSIITHESV